MKVFDNWLKIFDLIENTYTFESSLMLENLIQENYRQYNEIFKLNLIEFGNKRFTPYVHVLCHLPDIMRRFGKFSIFNTQGFHK